MLMLAEIRRFAGGYLCRSKHDYIVQLSATEYSIQRSIVGCIFFVIGVSRCSAPSVIAVIVLKITVTQKPRPNCFRTKLVRRPRHELDVLKRAKFHSARVRTFCSKCVLATAAATVNEAR